MKHVIRFICFVCMSAGLLACSEKLDTPGKLPEKDSAPLQLSLKSASGTVADNLHYMVYIFRKSAPEPRYLLTDSLNLQPGIPVSQEKTTGQLRGYSFRYLFLATPAAAREIIITGPDGQTLPYGTSWEDILITGRQEILSGDNYYGILDKTGEQLIADNTVSGMMNRLTGRIVTDIYRAENTVDIPADILSPSVRSVLDRVYKIEAEYTGLPQSVGFDVSGNILCKTGREEAYSTQSALKMDQDGSLRVTVPQTETGLEIAACGKKGSVRIAGVYSLPVQNRIRLKTIFRFYDTTPKCDPLHTDNAHTASCFTPDRLEVNFPAPAAAGTDLLSVLPDHFTVLKAGIRYDRIIDLDNTSGLNIQWEWNNQ